MINIKDLMWIIYDYPGTCYTIQKYVDISGYYIKARFPDPCGHRYGSSAGSFFPNSEYWRDNFVSKIGSVKSRIPTPSICRNPYIAIPIYSLIDRYRGVEDFDRRVEIAGRCDMLRFDEAWKYLRRLIKGLWDRQHRYNLEIDTNWGPNSKGIIRRLDNASREGDQDYDYYGHD